MRIFADYHHGSLYHSLQLLSQRLVATIHRPIGESWFTEGFWKIAEPYGNAPETIKQYLSVDPYAEIPFFCNKEAQEFELRGQYVVQDAAHHSQQLAMTLELFKEVKFDVIIVTYPQHLESWLHLQKECQPQAKVVFQVGNNGWSRYFPRVKNVLSSARHAKERIPNDVQYVEYHQEFPLEYFFPSELERSDYDTVKSFVNCPQRLDIIDTLSLNTQPELHWKAFGHGAPDGPITGINELGFQMRTSRFGYHYKPGGDGYGHILHNWFASGVPLIGDYTQYIGTLGEDLFTSDLCIPMEAAPILRIHRDEDYYQDLRKRVIGRWNRVVNFDNEFDTKLKLFFENLR